MDFWELSFNYANLAEPPPPKVDRPQLLNSSARYEFLYKAQMLRTQRANALIYAVGGMFFIGGSTLFFPAMEEIIMHGGWLYITGCMLTLLGAVLAALTASELRKTAPSFTYGSSLLQLPCWSDEEATMSSCLRYK